MAYSVGVAKGSHLCIRSADLMASPKHRRHVSWESGRIGTATAGLEMEHGTEQRPMGEHVEFEFRGAAAPPVVRV
jgi:hypothetical protein